MKRYWEGKPQWWRVAEFDTLEEAEHYLWDVMFAINKRGLIIREHRVHRGTRYALGRWVQNGEIISVEDREPGVPSGQNPEWMSAALG